MIFAVAGQAHVIGVCACRVVGQRDGHASRDGKGVIVGGRVVFLEEEARKAWRGSELRTSSTRLDCHRFGQAAASVVVDAGAFGVSDAHVETWTN